MTYYIFDITSDDDDISVEEIKNFKTTDTLPETATLYTPDEDDDFYAEIAKQYNIYIDDETETTYFESK